MPGGVELPAGVQLPADDEGSGGMHGPEAITNDDVARAKRVAVGVGKGTSQAVLHETAGNGRAAGIAVAVGQIKPTRFI